MHSITKTTYLWSPVSFSVLLQISLNLCPRLNLNSNFGLLEISRDTTSRVGQHHRSVWPGYLQWRDDCSVTHPPDMESSNRRRKGAERGCSSPGRCWEGPAVTEGWTDWRKLNSSGSDLVIGSHLFKLSTIFQRSIRQFFSVIGRKSNKNK